MPVAALLASACSSSPAADVGPAIERVPSSISIRAASQNLWSNKDVMSVFDEEGTRVNFTTSQDNVPNATFSTTEWTGKAPVYAAFCSKKNETTCTPGGVMGVFIKSAQSVSAKEKCSKDGEASVGLISGSPGSYAVEMFSITGFIRMQVKSSIVTKISATAVGSEKMAGYVDVDYASISSGKEDFWIPTDGKSTYSTVSIVPSAGGCFAVGDYLISVLPGKYSKGIKLTSYDDEGTALSETVIGAEEGLTLKRNDEIPVIIEIDSAFEFPGLGFEGVGKGDIVEFDKS